MAEKMVDILASVVDKQHGGRNLVHNESTRVQLEAISTALSELQAEHRKQSKRKPIGFIQPTEDNNDTER